MKKNHWPVYSKFWHYFDRFIYKSISNAFQGFIAKRNLEITYSEVIAHAAYKKLTGRIAQKKRVITIWDIQAKITKQAENEVKKARRALDWAEAAELKKENARIAIQKKLQKQLHKKLKAYLKAWPALANLLK